MGHKGTPFPHLQFMAQSVPSSEIVIMLGKGSTYDHCQCQGPKQECSVLPHHPNFALYYSKEYGHQVRLLGIT